MALSEYMIFTDLYWLLPQVIQKKEEEIFCENKVLQGNTNATSEIISSHCALHAIHDESARFSVEA